MNLTKILQHPLSKRLVSNNIINLPFSTAQLLNRRCEMRIDGCPPSKLAKPKPSETIKYTAKPVPRDPHRPCCFLGAQCKDLLSIIMKQAGTGSRVYPRCEPPVEKKEDDEKAKKIKAKCCMPTKPKRRELIRRYPKKALQCDAKRTEEIKRTMKMLPPACIHKMVYRGTPGPYGSC